MRRCSSEMNLTTRNDRQDQRQWNESNAPRRQGFWSSTKDSSVLSPQPALRRGSVQAQGHDSNPHLYQDAEAPATTEDDMLHYYQYGDAAPSVKGQQDSGAANSNRSSRRWSLKGNQQRGNIEMSHRGRSQGADVTPTPRSRRVSIDTGDSPSAPARRRSSFLGANGANGERRDMQPSPTPRRSSIRSETPAQTQEPQEGGSTDDVDSAGLGRWKSGGGINRLPIRKMSIIPFSWGPKSDRDDTESMASSASSSPSDSRRTSNTASAPGSILDHVPSLDHDYEPDCDFSAVDLPRPHRRRSFFGASNTSVSPKVEPATSDESGFQRPCRRASLQEFVSGVSAQQPSQNLESSFSSSSTSSSGSQASRRASFLGSILPRRDMLSGSVTVV
jgi:hypothetical protein